MPIFGLRAAGGDDLVELVGAHEGEHGVALVIVQARFLAEERIAEADIEPAVGHHEIDGVTICTRSSEPSATPVDSTVSCMHLSAAQAPVKRDIAQP